jgi:hypothetical protein
MHSTTASSMAVKARLEWILDFIFPRHEIALLFSNGVNREKFQKNSGLSGLNPALP